MIKHEYGDLLIEENLKFINLYIKATDKFNNTYYKHIYHHYDHNKANGVAVSPSDFVHDDRTDPMGIALETLIKIINELNNTKFHKKLEESLK